MIEIFVIRKIADRIGTLAFLKGLPQNRWILLTIVCWFAAEFIGATVAYNFAGNFVLCVAFAGYPLAYILYVLIKRKLNSYPDKENWVDTIGMQDIPE